MLQADCSRPFCQATNARTNFECRCINPTPFGINGLHKSTCNGWGDGISDRRDPLSVRQCVNSDDFGFEALESRNLLHPKSTVCSPARMENVSLLRILPPIAPNRTRGFAPKLWSMPMVEGNAYLHARTLPRNLDEAIDRMLACTPVIELLGEPFIKAFAKIKEAELMAFGGVISSWERNHLLLKM